MKVYIILSNMLSAYNTLNHSQSVEHVEGGRYMKIIEYNVIHPGVTEDRNMYNLEHKSIIDRLFFVTKNSFVEFVFMDSPEGSNEAVAFRIIKNSQNNSYELEVMHLQDVHDVYNKRLQNLVSEKTTPIYTPYWLSTAISTETKERIKEHNKQATLLKNSDELYKAYRPEPLKLKISNEFAEQLHHKTSQLIENFKGVGIPANINDGFEVTFRCVVEDELWTLQVHCPQGETLWLSTMFRKMIADAYTRQMNELDYLKLMGNMK